MTTSPSYSSTTSTPGPELPGAYPRTPKEFPLYGTNGNTTTPLTADQPEHSKDPATAASASIGSVTSVAGAGTGALSAGVDSVKETLFNATVSAAQYLPSNVVGYFPGGAAIVAASSAEGKLKDAQGMAISLPSQEHGVDASTSSQGVGSLPGPASEEGVAILPHEKAAEGEFHQDDTPDVKKDPRAEEKIPSSATVDGGSNSGSHFREEAPASSIFYPESSPTHPSKADKPVEPVPINLEPRTHPLAGEGSKWKGVPLDEEYQRDVVDNALNDNKLSTISTATPIASSISPSSQSKSLPRVPQNDSTTADVGHEKLSGVTSGSTSSSTVPSASSPLGTSMSPISPTTSPESPTAQKLRFGHKKDASVASTTSNAESGSSTGSESATKSENGTPVRRKKTTILTKLRGEAKIISGKLGGKEEKVEEGRRIVRGEE
ncbi:hypothetical protein GYMLUDRAFT_252478 [Collybiopsis luxurians FD-317 M1]|uniref:Uncharacterized protein n=1 Tax=Collybiopsis luxurians FD-317 M1 TaxID=944289 RepID=A0A0D0C0E3_9AGAR|nr:hypothetical protein GYMLUDRAFT_252478 [Collybiopsis luxurians FD-317 M1]